VSRNYVASKTGGAIHPALTVTSGSGEMVVLRRAWYSKLGKSATAAVVERSQIQRSSGGVTATAFTEKYDTRLPAALAPGEGWGTGPTVSGNPLVFTDVGDKPYALVNSWTPPRPWAGIYCIDAEQISLDNAGGAANTSNDFTLSWSEADIGLENRIIRGRRLRSRGLWHFHRHSVTFQVQAARNQNRNSWCGYQQRYAPYRNGFARLIRTGGTQTPVNMTATTLNTTSTIVRQVGKPLTATTVGTTSTIVRQTGKILSKTMAVTAASIVKQVGKPLTATTVGITATLQASKRTALAMTATTLTTTASIVKQVGKPLVATTVTTTSTIVRQTGKILSKTMAVTVATIVRQTGKPLTATTIVTTASMVLSKAFGIVMTATVTTTATIVRQIGKPLTAATVAVTATIVRQVGKALTATVSVSGVIVKQIWKSLIASQSALATLNGTYIPGGPPPPSVDDLNTSILGLHYYYPRRDGW
jgi:hypothetical protein